MSKRKPRHATLNIGEVVNAAYDEAIAPRVSLWQFRELAKGYWGFLTPEGETFTEHFKDRAAALAHVRQVETKRLKPSTTKAAAGSR